MTPQPHEPRSDSPRGPIEIALGLRWPIGIALGFCVLFAVNIAYIWTAIHVDDPIDPTYKATPR